MTQPQQGYFIGVDLGTSNTVAVIRHPDGRTRPLLVDGAPIMPSGVYVDETGRIHVGRDAYRMAGLDPSRFEPNPKRRIDEPMVLLGDREIATVDLLAAILASVARAAVEAVGFLPVAVLTHPAAWGTRRREALAAAARRAGWPPVTLVPEPVAAARYFADILRRPVPVGSALAVFDFGGGTLDVAVVRNDNGRFTVLGSGGIEDLGGLDVDAAVVDHLGTVIEPDLFNALRNPTGTAQRRDRRLFWDDVRGAKEMLSRATVAPITVPGRDQALHLTREELERVTDPLIRRAVWETGKVIHSSGLRPDQLAGLFLVGGSSRLPLAARLLHAELGIAPTVLEQPELPVAEGALAELAPAGYATESIPVSGVGPAPLSPLSPPTAPFSAPPVSPAYGGSPVSAPPMPPQYQPPQQPPMPPRPGPPRRGRKGLLVGVVAAVVVLALVGAAGYWFFFRDRINEVAFKTASDAGSLALADDLTSPVSATLGSRTIVGYLSNKQFHLRTWNLDDKKPGWSRDFDTDNRTWGIYPSSKGVIVTGTGGSASGGTLMLLGLDDGKDRGAAQAFATDDDFYFLKDAWVLHSKAAKKTLIMGWNGTLKLEMNDDKAGTTLLGATNVTDGRGPSDFEGRATNRDLDAREQFVTVDGKAINLRDAAGKSVRKWVDSSDSYANYAVFGNRLVVYTSSTSYTVRVFDLSKEGQPEQVYSADDKHRIKALTACGTDNLCILDTGADSTDVQLRMISIADKKQVWAKPAKGTESLLPVGEHILATGTGPASFLFDAKGNQLLKSEEQKAYGLRVTNGSLLFFSKAPSAYDGEVSLTGVTASSGEHVALGTIKVASSSCSWNASTIACVGAGKLQAWSFA